MPNYTYSFNSAELNAPVLTGAQGSLVTLLDNCLRAGFATNSTTSITRSGATATLTSASPHGMIFQGTVGQTAWVTIAGAGQTEYNGVFLATCTATNQFTFAVTGTPASPATGTITWARNGAGWTKPATATGEALFKMGGGNGFYLNVNDNGPGAGTFKEARMTGFESASAVDTGSGQFPTVAQAAIGIGALVARKSATADATARTWRLFCDDRTLHLVVNTGDVASTYLGFSFGDVYSELAGDGYRTAIIGRVTENSASAANSVEMLPVLVTAIQVTTSGHYIARSHLGTGGSAAFGAMGDPVRANALSQLSGLIPWPNGPNQAAVVSPVSINDASGNIRGRLRGFHHFLHAVGNVADGDVIVGNADYYAGKQMIVVKNSGNSGVYLIEFSNTWDTSA